MSADPVGDAWDALYETEMMRCCWCPSCNFYLPADEYKPDSKCLTVAAVEQIITARLDEFRARAVAAIEALSSGDGYYVDRDDASRTIRDLT